MALTGDDLALADVWDVAVHHHQVSLTDAARERMRAARQVVENAAHGTKEHTYGVNTGFGRFVSHSIPEELTEELQLRLLRSDAAAGQRARQGVLGSARGDRRAPDRVPQPRRAATCSEPGLGRRKRRPR